LADGPELALVLNTDQSQERIERKSILSESKKGPVADLFVED